MLTLAKIDLIWEELLRIYHEKICKKLRRFKIHWMIAITTDVESSVTKMTEKLAFWLTCSS